MSVKKLVWVALLATVSCQKAGGDADGGEPGSDAGVHEDGGGADGGGGPDGGISLEQFCRRVVDESCLYRLRCAYFSDAGLDACRRSEQDTWGRACARADAGLERYSPENGRDCLERLTGAKCWRSTSCGTGFFSMPESVFFDVTPPPCGSASCSSSTYCDEDCSGPACQPYAGVGVACDLRYTNGRTCDPALTYCEEQLDGGGLCRARKPNAAPCFGDECASRLCFFDSTSSSSTCIAPLADDAPCPSPANSAYCASGWCAPNLRCARRDAGIPCLAPADCGGGVAQAVCRELTLGPDGGVTSPGQCGGPSALGERCSMAWGRGSCDITVGQACVDGRCKRMTPQSLQAGDECIRPPFGVGAPYLGFAACPRGLTCQQDATAYSIWGRCKNALTEGEPCAVQFHSCADGLACEQGPDGGQVCLRLGGLAAACPCLFDLRCATDADGGKQCAPLLGAGATCLNTEVCAPPLICAGRTCQPAFAAGETCGSDFECADRACRNGRCVAMCRYLP